MGRGWREGPRQTLCCIAGTWADSIADIFLGGLLSLDIGLCWGMWGESCRVSTGLRRLQGTVRILEGVAKM